jgi:low temperature requirement protein LtrA
MTTATAARSRRFGPVLREGERVAPLELFFDLVFVLAITQCTALMADEPTWRGLAKGILVLGMLWWTWVGYSWLTSVVDPEEGFVRLVMFAAMAAVLVIALCIPEAFDDSALLLAVAYACVRLAHIFLFRAVSHDDPGLRASTNVLTVGTVIGTGLLVGASFADGALQGGIWAVALTLDVAGPYFFGAEGWKLVPGHFAERHGLIVLIALGESIVAVGAGAQHHIGAGQVTAAVLGVVIAGALWWMYFDVVALVAERRLSSAAPGRERNEIARDSFSFLHLPMIAGIVLFALGLKTTIGHVDEELGTVPAVALCGGTALYLLGHIAFLFRTTGRVFRRRTVGAVVLLALIPAAVAIPALAALALVSAVCSLVVAYEAIRHREHRVQVRHPEVAA